MGNGVTKRRDAQTLDVTLDTPHHPSRSSNSSSSSPISPTSVAHPTLEVCASIPNTSKDSMRSYQILISPQKELALSESVPFTPRGENASTFRYYCPLCMEFYKSILKSNNCCGNYICLGCTIDYLGSRHLEATSCNDILNAQAQLKGIPCPSCSTIGFCPAIVLNEEAVRDYNFSDTSATKLKSKVGLGSRSPLRIGDSYEDLKRKMIPFKIQLTNEDDVDEEEGEMCDKSIQEAPCVNIGPEEVETPKHSPSQEHKDETSFIESEARAFLLHILGQEGIDRLVKKLAMDNENDRIHRTAEAFVLDILNDRVGTRGTSSVRLPPLVQVNHM